MTDTETRISKFVELAELCDAVCLNFNLEAALASGMSVMDVSFLALFAAPSLEERAMIRAGELRRPQFDLTHRSHLHA